MSEVPLYCLALMEHPHVLTARPNHSAVDKKTYKKTHPPRTSPQAHAQGTKGVLGGWAFSHG